MRFQSPISPIRRLCALTGLALAVGLPAIADDGGSWSAGSWEPDLGDVSASPAALDGAVRTFYRTGDNSCWAGGKFNQPFNALAHWNGSSWEDPGHNWWSNETTVNAVMEYDGMLYAAGRFVDDSNGSVSIVQRFVTIFPGEGQWLPLLWASSNAPESEAFALAVHDGKLVIGGDYRADNGKTNLLAFDGSEFSVLGEDTANGPVYALASRDGGFHPSKLFAGGEFTNIGSMQPGIGGGPPLNTEQNLAVYQSGQWSQALGPANDTVYALYDVVTVMRSTLYIGGKFTQIDGVGGLGGIARHDGLNINPMSGGTGGTVHAIQPWNEGIAVGGEFTLEVDDEFAFNVASWSQSGEWRNLDDGVSGTVIDADFGAPVLALCRYNDTEQRGLYAGGNFLACGAGLGTNTNYAARLTSSFESDNPFEDDWVSNSSNTNFEEIPPYGLLVAPFNPGQDARFLWGIGGASMQRLGFEAQALMLDGPVDFKAIWEVMEPIHAQVDFTIYKPTNPGPFLPAPTVVDFQPYDLSAFALHGLQFEAVSSDDQVHKLEHLVEPAQNGAIIETTGNIRAITTNNGDEAYEGRYLVIEFDNPSTVYYRTPGENDVRLQQYVQDVTRIQMALDAPLENSDAWATGIDVALTQPIVIDRLDCGFGYQGNQHTQTGGEMGISIADGGANGINLSSGTAGSLDITGPDAGAAYQGIGMDFSILNTEINASLSIDVNSAIVVGNPADLPGEHKTSFNITNIGLGILNVDYQPMTELAGRGAQVQLLQGEAVVREYFSDLRAMTLEVVDAFQGQAFDASVDCSNNEASFNWSDPRFIVLHDPMLQDPITELDITGWRIKVLPEEADPDGDGIADDIQPTSLSVSTERQITWTIFNERFMPIETTMPGDLNGDGRLDGGDLGELLSGWGNNPGHPGDLDGDGMVSGSDLGMFLALWVQ